MSADARPPPRKTLFATNRRIHGTVDHDPVALSSTNCRRTMSRSRNPRAAAGWGGSGGYGPRASTMWKSFGSSYTTPGWQRAQANRARKPEAQRT